jgi:hypothetical protein
MNCLTQLHIRVTSEYSRKRNDGIQHPNPGPDLAHIRDLGNAWGDHRDERPREESVRDSKYDYRCQRLGEHPEQQTSNAREESGRHEDVEAPDDIGEVCRGDTPKEPATIHYG